MTRNDEKKLKRFAKAVGLKSIFNTVVSKIIVKSMSFSNL
jgi:hypothetical protein